LAVVISHLKDYCENKLDKTNLTKKITVAGVAGSGKSTWINTLVSLVRRLFGNNDTIGVYGPTGSAAFNAGGETINRGFRVPISNISLKIDGAKHGHLLKKFARTVAIVIDERSMLEADKFGCVKHYMDECAHGGITNKDWGGVPIVILVGDDYQIPPIGYGAFYALEPNQVKTSTFVKAGQLQCRMKGFDEFKAFGQHAVYLEGVKRVNQEQDQLRRILHGLRCEDSTNDLEEQDIQRLLELDVNHAKFSRKEREELQQTAMYLFANKEPRDALNAKMLLKANLEGNPVARIKSTTIDMHGKRVASNPHFENDRSPHQVMLCKTAKVALNGQNICPAIGLYHGTLGTVEDIVYRSGEKPHLGDLPAYVMVNFSQYRGQQLVPNSKQSVPISPMTTRCKFFCCTRTYIPLTLAYGKTVHTFQGQTVGPVTPGRPENAIQRIIVEPGTRQFEGNNVGLFYTTASRPTTIGRPDDKMSSAIYFDGPDFCKARITRLTTDKNGRLYKKANLRQKWVEYMKNNNLNQRRYTNSETEELFEWIKKTRYTCAELDEIIKKNDKK
jgi:hypothetical protein